MTDLTDEQIDALWRTPMSADWEHREFARAVLAAAVPPGYKVVPIDPSVEMRRAAAPWIANYHMMRAGDKTNAITDVYRAMIQAAPERTP